MTPDASRPRRSPGPRARRALTALLALACGASCDRPTNNSGAGAGGQGPAPVPAPTPAVRDSGPPPDRTAVRRVITLYRWSRTEPGDDSTHGESIEHGSPQLHLVVEAHRDPESRGWITVGALAGAVRVPESVRMRPLVAAGGEWHVPGNTHNEYTLEQFGGTVRSDEPVTVLLASAPGERQTLQPGTDAPATVRLPAAATLPATPRAAVGQYDAIVVLLVPVTNRRGGRYLVYAVDMLPQPGGFSANGVMGHAPSSQEIERYARWMRDPNGMARDRNPPIAMSPIDRR